MKSFGFWAKAVDFRDANTPKALKDMSRAMFDNQTWKYGSLFQNCAAAIPYATKLSMYFQVINLPVEFDTSNRAKRILTEYQIVDQETQ